MADPTAKAIARHAETGQVAAAIKRHDGWTSVYIGAAQELSDDLLNHLAREAGAYVAGQRRSVNRVTVYTARGWFPGAVRQPIEVHSCFQL